MSTDYDITTVAERCPIAVGPYPPHYDLGGLLLYYGPVCWEVFEGFGTGHTAKYVYHLVDQYFTPPRLLYVGQTKNVATRLRQHSKTKWWWASNHRVEMVAVYCYPIANINEAERRDIQLRDPVHNIAFRQVVS